MTCEQEDAIILEAARIILERRSVSVPVAPGFAVEELASEVATERVIRMFGGMTALAKALGHGHPTTVQGWKDRGVIPSRQIPFVLEAAKREGLNVSVADFFDTVGEGAV